MDKTNMLACVYMYVLAVRLAFVAFEWEEWGQGVVINTYFYRISASACACSFRPVLYLSL